MQEGFRPAPNVPPDNILNILKFYGRIFFDFQNRTIYISLKQFLKEKKGKILDVGCGASPYKPLVNKQAEYIGVDIVDADKFQYQNNDIMKFDGFNIPLPESSVDYIFCTEVIEHSPNAAVLIDDMYRVLRKGGRIFLTVPWSARFHYIPYDYFRYTPTTLSRFFKNFSATDIIPRGTDITSIAAKVIVIYIRMLIPKNIGGIINFLLAFILSPFLILAIAAGHLSLLFRIGSTDDPLGYTVIAEK
jgi:SAM-dependent methyltransferase